MKSLSKEYLERIKRVMKERRIALSLTQKEVAERSGVNLRTLQHFEQKGEINFEKLLKLLVLYRMDKRAVMCIEDRSWWTVEELERSETKTKVRK